MRELVGLIAVRTASSRLPGKAFLEIDGRPVVQVLTDRVAASDAFDDFVVCTTTSQADDRIADFCAEAGYRCFRGPVEDVMARFLGALDEVPARFAARITGDNPFTDFDTMSRSLRVLQEHDTDYSRPIGVPLGTAAEVIRAEKLAEIHERTTSPELTEYMTYFFEMAPFVKCEVLEVEEEIRFPDLRLTVDYETDLEFVDGVLRHFEGRVPALAETVAYCRSLAAVPLVEEDAAAARAIKDRIAFA